jgi:hypothetical protein
MVSLTYSEEQEKRVFFLFLLLKKKISFVTLLTSVKFGFFTHFMSIFFLSVTVDKISSRGTTLNRFNLIFICASEKVYHRIIYPYN